MVYGICITRGDMDWIFPAFIFVIYQLCSAGEAKLFLTKIKAQYFPDEPSLRIEFDTSQYNYSLYYMELLRNPEDISNCFEMSDAPVWEGNIIGQYPDTVYFLNDLYLNGNYCIRVKPVREESGGTCSNGCRTESTKITIDSPGRPSVPNCRNWTADVEINHWQNKFWIYTIKVAVMVDSAFQKCFNVISVSLWSGVQDECNTFSGFVLETAVVPVVPENFTVSKFTDLRPGNYCVRLNAQSPYCTGQCSPFYTDVHHLTNGSDISTIHQEPGNYILIISLSTIGILAFVVLVVYIFLGHRRADTIPGSGERTADPLLDLKKIARKRAKKLEIVLLYSRDFPAHAEVVKSFYNFLLTLGFKKVHFDLEEQHLIFLDLHSWVEQVTGLTENRRFIIVESEGGVLQEEGRKRIKVVRPVEEDCLDDIFPYALQMLKYNIPISCAYRSVFVVKFRYTPEAMKINSFNPNRRYVLPGHLFELYDSLISFRDCTGDQNNLVKFQEEMENNWKQFLDQNFIPCIENSEKLLQKYPKLVAESFVEEDIFSIV